MAAFEVERLLDPKACPGERRQQWPTPLSVRVSTDVRPLQPCEAEAAEGRR